MSRRLKMLRTALGVLAWFGFAAALILMRPEYWDA
jgi:hypothetical protein